MSQGWFNGVHSNYKHHTYSRHTCCLEHTDTTPHLWPHSPWRRLILRTWSWDLLHRRSTGLGLVLADRNPADRAGMDGSHQQRNDLMDTDLREGQRKNHLASFFMFSVILLCCDLFGSVASFRYCLKCECKLHNVKVFLSAEWVGKYLFPLSSPQIPQ